MKRMRTNLLVPRGDGENKCVFLLVGVGGGGGWRGKSDKLRFTKWLTLNTFPLPLPLLASLSENVAIVMWIYGLAKALVLSCCYENLWAQSPCLVMCLQMGFYGNSDHK